MALDIVMPQMGESITEATILKWHRKVGETIGKDETLYEISTDKVDAEIPAPMAGTLLEILVEANATVPVGTVVGRIGGAGEQPAAAASGQPAGLRRPPEPEPAPAPAAAAAPARPPAPGPCRRRIPGGPPADQVQPPGAAHGRGPGRRPRRGQGHRPHGPGHQGGHGGLPGRPGPRPRPGPGAAAPRRRPRPGRRPRAPAAPPGGSRRPGRAGAGGAHEPDAQDHQRQHGRLQAHQRPRLHRVRDGHEQRLPAAGTASPGVRAGLRHQAQLHALHPDGGGQGPARLPGGQRLRVTGTPSSTSWTSTSASPWPWTGA